MITISTAVQHLPPRHAGERMEGVAFSTCGRLLAAATSESNKVLLFRRRAAGGMFELTPYLALDAGIEYPHDVSFSLDPDSRLLAVAQRSGAIAVFGREARGDGFGPEPAAVIGGPRSGLSFSDGVAFMPPAGDRLVACDVATNSVCFYRTRSRGGLVHVEDEPFDILTSPVIDQPDGLAFSPCGEFLALANHGGDSVAIFRRGEESNDSSAGGFDPRPWLVIRDRSFRFPHSVAFSFTGSHLVVTNAGANYFSTYCCNRYGAPGREKVTWSREANIRKTIIEDEVFREVNCRNKLEGGPKGTAVHGDELAVCSPEAGIKLFRLDDDGPVRSDAPVYALADDPVPGPADGWSAQQDQGGLVLRQGLAADPLRLNESAAAVWQLCDGKRTVGELVALLAPLADDAATIDLEVRETVELLDSHGLLAFRR